LELCQDKILNGKTMKHKKGQLQVISIFMQVLLALFFLGSGLASNITYFTQASITNNNLTGLMAFMLAYMNLWIVLGLMLVTSIGSSVMLGRE
jgi:hypothetical protein